MKSGAELAAKALENPTEVLLERAAANEARLAAEWGRLRRLLGDDALPDDPAGAF